MKSVIKNILRKLPAVNSFIRHHNPGLKEILNHSKPITAEKPVIIDVGANKGQTIEFFLRHYPAAEIYSFEPTSSIFENLKLKFSNYNTVHLFNSALGEEEGETVLFTSGFSPTNSIYKPNVQTYEKYDSGLSGTLSKSNEEKCMMNTFNNWYAENLVDRTVDLMKIDVQGAEFNVIKGGQETLRARVKSIVIELQYLDFYQNSRPYYETLKLLHETGFYLYGYFDFNRDKDYQLLENNALFLNASFH